MTLPITVRTANGHVWYFDSLTDAVIRVNRTFPITDLKYGFLCEWLKPSMYGMGFAGAGDNVVFYDECGLIIPVWKVKETFYNIPAIVRDPPYWMRYTGRYPWRKIHIKPEHFRCQPVPNTGKRNWGGYRKIRTSQEIRENKFFSYDIETKEYRFKIRRLGLPDDREDIYRSDGRNKNWKRHRRHQWKIT